jgi:long-chain acyl-CoA synthetase
VESLIDLLEASSRRYGDQVALAMCRGLGTETWTYARLWQAARAAATTLQEAGIAPRDRVLIRAGNSPELVAVYFGCMLAGAILVPLDDGSTDAFVSQVARATDARLLIAGSRRVMVDAKLPILGIDALQFDCPPAPRRARPRPEDVVEIVFTSGTTGTPKGVVLTHANILANVRSGEQAGVLPRSDTYRLLSLLPLSHMFEQTAGLYLPLSYGASVTYAPSRQPSTVLHAMRRRRATGMVAVPLVLELLWRGIEREVRRRGQWQRWQTLLRGADHVPLPVRRVLFASLHNQLGGAFEFFLCGGAHLPRALETAWERVGVRVIQGYGATECSPIIAANTFKRRVPGTVGGPVPGVHVRLTDEGEIQIGGENVTAGYWNDPDSTRAAFTADGWYRSGDLAQRTRAGDLVLHGRLRDLIVLPNGLNVHPEDVEQALEREPEIAESVVVAVPDRARGGLRIHAVLVPAPGSADSVQLEAAVRRANARLAPQQQVIDYSVRTAESLPRTSSGKVKRHALQLAPSLAEAAADQRAPAAPTREDRPTSIQRILAEVARVPRETIEPRTDLTLDLHVDSLARVELAVRLEEELGVAVDESQLAQVQSVQELVDLAARADTSERADVAFPRWALARPSRWVRRAAQSALLFPLHASVCRSFEVSGREHAALARPALFIANHNSHLDTPSVLRALPAATRARIAVAAAADYFYQNRPLGIAASLLLNTFPFSREHAVRTSLAYCAELIDAGWSILLYPEGTRSTSGQLQPFRSGIGLLARELGLPVVPVAVRGTHAVLPKGRSLPRRGPVSVRFGPPVVPNMTLDALAITGLLQRALEDLMSALGSD